MLKDFESSSDYVSGDSTILGNLPAGDSSIIEDSEAVIQELDTSNMVRDKLGNLFVRDAEPFKESYFDEENLVHYYEVR